MMSSSDLSLSPTNPSNGSNDSHTNGNHKKRRVMGIFGGTFDPIHHGHLRAAIEIYEKLPCHEMRMIPCKFPPHRTSPEALPEHRIEMLRLAVEDSALLLDEREMDREGPSYSVDTLMSIRSEFPQDSLCMVVGVDAFLGLPSWYQWEKLLQLANIVVMHRAGWAIPKTGILADFLEKHALKEAEELSDFVSGRIYLQHITMLDIKASEIRTILGRGFSPRYLLPDSVLKYIHNHHLYGYNS